MRPIAGPGFSFSVPAGWHVVRTPTSAAAHEHAGAQTLVSAGVYRLGRLYDPARFAEAARELDGVASRLALAAGGAVTASETTTVAGMRIRAYRFTALLGDGRRYDDRVGFVLSGRREVQLLCQAPAGARDPDGACSLLFSSFALSG